MVATKMERPVSEHNECQRKGKQKYPNKRIQYNTIFTPEAIGQPKIQLHNSLSPKSFSMFILFT